ncbi:MAG: hypothetical protein E6H52_03100 [Betaproteobacteria bacterium]|nr:MAG: hypothetical protein E6H52_03100 [Betaproteobacteria bacterium]
MVDHRCDILACRLEMKPQADQPSADLEALAGRAIYSKGSQNRRPYAGRAAQEFESFRDWERLKAGDLASKMIRAIGAVPACRRGL